MSMIYRLIVTVFYAADVVFLGTKSKHEERWRRLYTVKESGNFRNKESVLLLYE